jgi:hypothetical protein
MLSKRSGSNRAVPIYLDTPAGIITPGGLRFATTQALLEEYAGPVLEKEPLERLIVRTEVWLRSAQTLALWLLPILLLFLDPLLAGGLSLFAYVAWDVVSPTMVSRRVAATLRILELPLVQGVLYVAVLSILGSWGRIGAVGIGLAGFIGFRWQLIPIALRPLVGLLRRPLLNLPAPDQVLRGFVLRGALRHDVRLPQIEDLRDRLLGR